MFIDKNLYRCTKHKGKYQVIVNELKLDADGLLVTGSLSDVFVKCTQINIGSFIDEDDIYLSQVPYTSYKWIKENSVVRREILLYENLVQVENKSLK